MARKDSKTALDPKTVTAVIPLIPLGVIPLGAVGESACPTFTLRADQPGHLRALIGVVQELGPGHPDLQANLGLIREFEIFAEAGK